MPYSFNLDAGETVITTVRRHWITLVPVIVSSGLLVIAAAVLSYLAGRYGKSLTLSFPTAATEVILLLLIAVALLTLLAGWWIYTQNQFILTNMHLVKVEQNGLFGRRVSQLSLSRVQDVTGERQGLVATLLDYGNVVVETAGEEENFVFTLAPHPQAFADELLQAHDRYADSSPKADGVAA